MSEAWEQGGTEVSTKAVSWGKPGDFIKGTFTAQKKVTTRNGENTLFELKGIIGSFHEMDGKKNPVEPAIAVEAGAYYNVWGGKDVINGLFAKSKLGDIVSIKFESETESKTKGNAPFKSFKTLQFGPDAEYMGQSSDTVQAASEAELI